MANQVKQYTYKNTSGRTQALVGVGSFKAGETFTTLEPVSNPNFTAVTTSQVDKQKKAAEVNAAPTERTASNGPQTAKGVK